MIWPSLICLIPNFRVSRPHRHGISTKPFTCLLSACSLSSGHLILFKPVFVPCLFFAFSVWLIWPGGTTSSHQLWGIAGRSSHCSQQSPQSTTVGNGVCGWCKDCHCNVGRSVDETPGSYDSRCTCQLSQTEIKPGSPGENKPSHKATQGQPLGWPIISDIEKSPADLWRWGHSLLHYSEFLLELRAVSIQMRENSPCQLITDTDNKIIPSQNKANIELFNNLTAGLYLIDRKSVV